MANVEKLKVLIEANNNTRQAFRRANSQISQMQEKFRSVGESMQRVGMKMTQSITAPILGAAGAAVKFSTDFEKQAARVRSTADLTAKQIEVIGETVDDVAVRTGKATNDIFQGFQKAVSGSLNVAESQELVREAAEASASGFGNIEELVNVSTTGFDLFTDTAGSAKEVLNQIVNAAQNTQVEVRNMASAFGRGSSVASKLGLTQNEFASILGVVSERFGDTQRGGRAVASMLRTLLKPSKEAATNLQETFGSVKNFREELSNNAIGTLKKLKKRLNENNKGLQNVIRSGNALNAVQVLLADNGDRANKVLDKQADAAGSVDEAFIKSASFSRVLARAWQALKDAGRAVGDVLTNQLSGPLKNVINRLQDFEEWFKGLDKNTQMLIITIGAVAAAIGPLIAILGTFSILLGSISIASLGVAAAIAGLAAAGVWLANNWESVTSTLESFWETLKKTFLVQILKNVFKGLVNYVRNQLIPAFREFWRNHGRKVKTVLKGIAIFIGSVFLVALTLLVAAIGAVVITIKELIDLFNTLGNLWENWIKPAMIELGEAIIKWILEPLKDVFDWLGKVIDRFTDFLDKVASAKKDGFLGKLADKVGGSLPDVFDFSGSFDSGGVIPGKKGEPKLAKVHGGETVLPTHKKGFSSGGDVNITVNGDVSGREVIDKVKRQLKQDLQRETKLATQ